VRAILADQNNEGHVAALARRLQSEPWREFWESLRLSVLTFADLGLLPETPDVLLWQACQQHEAILITINRNADGPDSLEATIRGQNTSTSLPVMTLANPTRFLQERDYAERVVEQLLVYLLDIDSYRGAGRLYLP